MTTTDYPTDHADRERAYRAGAAIARARLAGEAPEAAAALDGVAAGDILVVRGCYDHVELVLAALGLPATVINAEDLPLQALRPAQLLVINCPGQLPRRAIGQVRAFVAAGGSLFTTDWALRHVVEPAFPGMVAYNERPTGDEVVRVVLRAADHPLLAGVIDGADDPQWWLEGSSYPIRVVDRERVTVLIDSPELAGRYGEAAVAVTFRHGEGEVLHLLSHFYLQRTELRERRHMATAAAYAAEKGVAPSAPLAAELDELSLGEVESAQTSARLFANIVAAKKGRGARGPR